MSKDNYLETEDKTKDGTKEKIHKIEVEIGKEAGERVAKKATEGIAGRRRRYEEELED